MKKKIIIIGGTGFIGFHLAKFLIKKNYEVISVSRKNPKKIRFLKKVKYIIVNIVQKKKLLKSLKKYLDTDYIICIYIQCRIYFIFNSSLCLTAAAHLNCTSNPREFCKAARSAPSCSLS